MAAGAAEIHPAAEVMHDVVRFLVVAPAFGVLNLRQCHGTLRTCAVCMRAVVGAVMKGRLSRSTVATDEFNIWFDQLDCEVLMNT